MGVQYPKVKGSIVSWGNLKFVLQPLSSNGGGSQTFKTDAFAAVDWDEKLEPEKVPGAGPMHIGRTIGIYEANASMSLYKDEGLEFLKVLQTIAGQNNGYGEIEFDLILSWEPLNGQGRIFTVKLLGARIAGHSEKNAPGAGATVIEMPLSIDRVEKIAADGTVLRLI
jgi:hypothetical protein